jgi:NhaA family Na+:H+ antiporter
MSLFINNLAFADQALIDSAKIGILIGSVVAGTLGFVVLKAALKSAEKNEAVSKLRRLLFLYKSFAFF